MKGCALLRMSGMRSKWALSCDSAQAGFGMTAPDPRWHPRNLTMFDIGREAQSDNEGIEPRIAHAIGNMLQAIAGGCQLGLCKVRGGLKADSSLPAVLLEPRSPMI